MVRYNGVKLKKGTDYTIKYKKNKNAGKARVVITGKGKYRGNVTKTFRIKKAKLTWAKLNGKSKTLKAGKDYRITYKYNKKNKTTDVILKGKGNYKGVLRLKGKIR